MLKFMYNSPAVSMGSPSPFPARDRASLPYAPHALRRILLVDDDAELLAVVSVILESVGTYDVRTVLHAKQAFAEAADFLPDLILLDVILPDLDGLRAYQFLEQLQQREPALRHTAVAFWSAWKEAPEVAPQQSCTLGGRDIEVIRKPVDPMLLPVMLERIWRAWHAASPRTNSGDRM